MGTLSGPHTERMTWAGVSRTHRTVGLSALPSLLAPSRLPFSRRTRAAHVQSLSRCHHCTSETDELLLMGFLCVSGERQWENRRASVPHSSCWDFDTDTGLKRIRQSSRHAMNKCQCPSQKVTSQGLTFCLQILWGTRVSLIMTPIFLTSFKTALLLTGQREASIVGNLRWPCACLLITLLMWPSIPLFQCKPKKGDSPNLISS